MERYSLKDDGRYIYLDDGTYKTATSRYTGERTQIIVNGTLAAQTTTEGTQYFTTDLFGSVSTVSDSYGYQLGEYTYDAFGSLVQGDLTGSTDFGYLGKQKDPTSRLYNYGYRDYKSQTARFTTLDPIRDGSNWFVYVNNDPVNHFDILGLCEGSDNSRQLTEKEIELMELLENFKYYDEPKYTKNGLLILEVDSLKPLPDSWEMVGDATSTASLGINLVAMGSVAVGAFPVVGTCSTISLFLDGIATVSYFISGDTQKAGAAAISFALDVFPFLKPEFSGAYNEIAERFIDATSKKFISNSAGYANYLAWPIMSTYVGISSNETLEE